MALSNSVVSELLEAFRAGEGVDLIRESVRLVMQDLIEVEAANHIGAGATSAVTSEPPNATGPGRGWSQRKPAMSTGDPEATAGVVLPRHLATPPA